MVVVKAYPDITSKIELLNKEMKCRKKLKASLNIKITIMQELTEEALNKEWRKWLRKLDPWYNAREKLNVNVVA